MAAVERDQKDLVLGPGSHAFVLDKSKGQISVWTGPVRVSLSNTDDTVSWDRRERRFVPIPQVEAAILPNVVAREGEYIILENPASHGEGRAHPPAASNASAVDLAMGKTTVIHGPAFFALWPMQSATVVPGHILRSDQYLIVKVTDESEARANFDKAVIKGSGKAKDLIKIDELTTGRLFVIPGTEVNFYMPCPGVEVLRLDGAFVQDAVTVEAMEYAYLRDQSGEKRYAYGPDVVFPEPTETFVTRTLDDGSVAKTFRVIELTETSGLYIKVTADHEEEDGTKRKAGDELFITGATTPIYRPRAEHMLIRQGGSEIHFSIAIPDAGSGYYVLNKRPWTDNEGVEHKDGVVELVRGPKTLLIDPRNQTLTRRALPLHLVALMYPGNEEAYAINESRLTETAAQLGSTGRVVPAAAMAYNATSLEVARGGNPAVRRSVGREFQGDVANRPVNFQKPRAIDLGSSKYDGAPRMAIRPGYAVMLVNSTGERRVVKNGEVALLEYDEYPTVISLSTGTPKSGTTRKKDVYLRLVTKISDEISLETADGVRLKLHLSYRVRFEGDPTHWFDIEDLVGFMTDNMRSIVHHAVTQVGIRDFYKEYTSLIRAVVLGKDGTGREFTENGLRIYDVDVLELSFEDHAIAELFDEAAKAAFQDELFIAKHRRQFEMLQATTEIAVAKAALTAESALRTAESVKKQVQADAEAAIARILANAAQAAEQAKARLSSLTDEAAEVDRSLTINKLRTDAAHAVLVAGNDEKVRLLKSEVEASVTRLAAIQPGLIEALTQLGDVELLDKVAKHLNVQTILGGTSVSSALHQVFAGTRFESLLEQTTGKGKTS